MAKLIKKAQKFDGSQFTPVNTQQPAAGPSSVVSHQAGNIQSIVSNPDVKEMQLALINIYDTFKYYPMFNKDPDYREKNTDQYDYDKGSDTFLTFLLNRYVKKSPIIGQESQTNYPNALHGSGKDLSSTTPINLVRLIESLKVFTQYDEKSKEYKEPNGVWNNYTNNALKNLYAIVSGMFNLMDKLKLESNSYTQSDLENLKDNIPQNPKLLQNQSKSARAITVNIQKIKKFLGDFMSEMSREKGAYSAYVRQQKPFDAKFTNKPNWDDKDQAVFKLNSSPYIPITLFSMPKDISSPQQGNVPVMLANILSKKDFEDFITNNSITVDGKDPLKDNTAREKLISYMENQTKTMQPKTQNQEKWI